MDMYLLMYIAIHESFVLSAICYNTTRKDLPNDYNFYITTCMMPTVFIKYQHTVLALTDNLAHCSSASYLC